MIFTKNKEGVRAIRAVKCKKCVAGKYTRARAPLARKYTNRIFESKDGRTSMKIVNYIEGHNFCWNDLLTKSNRSEIQTYKVEERTFGTPCIFFVIVSRYADIKAIRSSLSGSTTLSAVGWCTSTALESQKRMINAVAPNLVKSISIWIWIHTEGPKADLSPTCI